MRYKTLFEMINDISSCEYTKHNPDDPYNIIENTKAFCLYLHSYGYVLPSISCNDFCIDMIWNIDPNNLDEVLYIDCGFDDTGYYSYFAETCTKKYYGDDIDFHDTGITEDLLKIIPKV